MTAPNLEDCGLLALDYEGLRGDEGLLGEAALWDVGFKIKVDRNVEQFVDTPVPLRDCPADLREEILRTLLDVLRRSLAVKSDVFDPRKQLDLVEQTKPRLLENTVWYLEDARELAKSVVDDPASREVDGARSMGNSWLCFRRFFVSGRAVCPRPNRDAALRAVMMTSSASSGAPRTARGAVNVVAFGHRRQYGRMDAGLELERPERTCVSIGDAGALQEDSTTKRHRRTEAQPRRALESS